MTTEKYVLSILDDLLELVKQDAAPAAQNQWYYTRTHPAPKGVTPEQGPRGGWRWDPQMARAAGLSDQDIDSHLKTEVIEIGEDSGEEDQEFEETLREGEIESESRSPAEKKLISALSSNTQSKELQALDDTGVLDKHFSEISDLKGTPQREDYHAEGDVFIHTKMTLDEAAKITERFPDEKDKKIIMLATLCHDLGKPATATPEGRAIGHAEAGVEVAESILIKLTED